MPDDGFALNRAAQHAASLEPTQDTIDRSPLVAEVTTYRCPKCPCHRVRVPGVLCLVCDYQYNRRLP